MATEVVHRDDMGVAEHRCGVCFEPEPFGRGLVRSPMEHLHGHRTAQNFVDPAPDPAHAATADRLTEPVPLRYEHGTDLPAARACFRGCTSGTRKRLRKRAR
jgi:hypothetical protein